MNHKVRKFFFLLFFSSFAFCTLAQNERLDDLVPYRQGNKWGIVHHDGKPFYPAILDSIIIGRDWNTRAATIYQQEEKGGLLAKVIYAGKPAYLTTDKKRRPANFRTKFPDVMLMDGGGSEQQGNIRPYKKVFSDSEITEDDFPLRKTWEKIEVRLKSGKVNFYKQGVLLQGFEAEYYVPVTDSERYSYNGAILIKNNTWAYGNFETGTVTIPFSPYPLQRCDYKTDWFIQTKDGKRMIVDRGGNRVTGPYHFISADVYTNEEKFSIMIAGDGDTGQRFLIYPAQDKASASRYDSIRLLCCMSYNKKELLFKVISDGKMGVIDSADKIIVPPNYDHVIEGYYNILILRDGDKYGFKDMNTTGVIKEPEYDKVDKSSYNYPFNENGIPYTLVQVWKNGRMFYADNQGREFIDLNKK